MSNQFHQKCNIVPYMNHLQLSLQENFTFTVVGKTGHESLQSCVCNITIRKFLDFFESPKYFDHIVFEFTTPGIYSFLDVGMWSPQF